MKNKTEFWKVLGIGDIDYEFTLSLSQAEANFLKFDLDKINSLQECKSLLDNEEVREKMTINSKNSLVNLLLFLNKTNNNKTFVEFLSLNSLLLPNNISHIKDKVRTDFDDNFLFLIESNLISPCKFKLQINVENKGSKVFEPDGNSEEKKKAQKAEEPKQEKKIYAAEPGEEKVNKKKEEAPQSKKDELNKAELIKDSKRDKLNEDFREESKRDNPKKVESKPESRKNEINEDLKKDDKTQPKEEIKKQEHKEKIVEPKKEEQKQEVKKEETKKPEIKKEEMKSEPKKEEVKKEDIKKEEPKKEEQKKDQPKKEEIKKEEGKKEEPIKEDIKKEEVKKVEPKKEEKKDEPKKEENKKEERKEEIKKDEPKKEELKKEEPKKEELKKDDSKKEESKKEESIKQEPKKEEEKKEETKKEEAKKEETKKEESKKEETKKEEIPKIITPKQEELKKSDSSNLPINDKKQGEEKNLGDSLKKPSSKPPEAQENPLSDKQQNDKPKGKFNQVFRPIPLPDVERPTSTTSHPILIPEGKGEQYFSSIASENTTKLNQAVKNVSLENSNPSYDKSNLLFNIKYDFASVDYIFIDLNKFLTYKEISLSDLYDFLSTKIANALTNTSVILIFPNLDKVDQSQVQLLVELTSVCDIILYDKHDAMTLCSHLGYKVEDKNFEVRFMFLKEFKKNKNRKQKTSMFLEDFHKLTVVMQDTQSNLIVYHNDFNFEIGFKLDYFRTVTNNSDFLKFVFYGGFFSRVVQNQPFDVAFGVGLETFKKMLEILHNNLPIPDSPEYFLVQPKIAKSSKNQMNTKAATSTNFSKKKNLLQDRENKFVLDAVSMSNKRFKDSIYAQDSISASKKLGGLPYGTGSGDEKPKTSSQFYPSNKSPNQPNNSKALELEQRKLLSILEANEKIQQKLNKLLSLSPGGRDFLNSENDDVDPKPFYKKNQLPKLQGGGDMKFSQTSNDFNSVLKKKNLKPISKETYDRLTGANKTSYGEFKSPTIQVVPAKTQPQVQAVNQQNHLQNNQDSVNNQYNDFVNISGLLEGGSPKNANLNNNKGSPIKPEEANLLASSINPRDQHMNAITKQAMTTGGFNETVKKQASKPKPPRIVKELNPICNLGFIPEPEPTKVEEKKKPEFRDYTYFDNKFKKNRGFDKLLGEKEKKVVEVPQINNSDNERGRKEDYNDFGRSIEKKRKREEEAERRRKEEQRKLEEKLAEEKKLAEKKALEEEALRLQKEKEEKKEEEKKDDKKVEPKKEDGKKDEAKKTEPKKEEPKKEEKK